VSETKISFEQSEIRNNRQSEAAENTIDEKESPQKAKNDDNPEGVAKKMKKNAFFCRSVWPVFAKFLLLGKYLTFPCLLVYVEKI